MSDVNAVPYVRHIAVMHNKLVDAIGTVNSCFTYQVQDGKCINFHYINVFFVEIVVNSRINVCTIFHNFYNVCLLSFLLLE